MTVIEKTVDLSVHLINKPVQIHLVIFAVADDDGEEQTPEQEVWVGGTLTSYAISVEGVSITLDPESAPMTIGVEAGTYSITTLGEDNG